MEEHASFGIWVRRRRKSLDFTLEQLAQRVGCAAVTIKKIEGDARRPSHQVAERLAASLLLEPEDRPLFLRAARGECSAERLPPPHLRPSRSAAAVPPSASLADPRPTNLPAQVAPLIGRAEELAQLERMLAEPQVRLVTIVAPGGMGKTRLAQAIGCRQVQPGPAQLTRFADGVYLVELTPLESPAQLVAALRATLRLPLVPLADQSFSPWQQLLDYLREKKLLLVLDNAENLVDQAPLLKELLQSAPGIVLLVTSREQLQLREEQLFPLGGLTQPDRTYAPDLASYSSVQLFLQVARRARPDFAPSREELQAIAAICRLVEGMPLAIELAAAWIALLPPSALLAELRRGFDLLATELRDVPVRQRSIRAVCDASWQRLRPGEREAFARLSVFRGGVTREAAQVIAGADLPTLAALLRASLLTLNKQHDRYGIHELLRQYAAEQLDLQPDLGRNLYDQHACYYCALVARWGAQLRGARQREAQAALARERDNIRVAWQRAVNAGMIEALEPALDGLAAFLEQHCYGEEGEELYRTAADVLQAHGHNFDQLLLVRLRIWQAAFCRLIVRLAAARQLLQDNLALLATMDQTDLRVQTARAAALLRLGQVLVDQAHPDAERYLEESLELYRSLDCAWEASELLFELGRQAQRAARFTAAEQLLRSSIELRERCGDLRGAGYALQQLSMLMLATGRYQEGLELAGRCYAIFETFEDRVGRAVGSRSLGKALLWLGRMREARRLLEESLALYQELGLRRELGTAHDYVSNVLTLLGEFEAGEQHANKALSYDRSSGRLPLIADDYWSLGANLLCQGRLEEAEQAFLESAMRCQRDHSEHYLAWADAMLGLVYWKCGELQKARERLLAALTDGLARRAFMPTLLSLAAIALLLADQGQPERALEIEALIWNLPFLAENRALPAMFQSHFAAVAALVPPEVAAAARRRGRELDYWRTAAEVLQEVQRCWGPLRAVLGEAAAPSQS